MSTLMLVLVVLAVVIALLLIGGFLASRRRYDAADYVRHVAEADEALELARAADKGWDREALDEAARRALASERPGWSFDEVHLVLVDDRPGVAEDSAHLVATGPEGNARVILRRHEGAWTLDRVE